ncbi:amidohydrolase family protein [Pseudonocardia sp. H11422]|uniref:amidohydrolase family protein n=1 Tax=Pseudonocardia sp. H11422 TaxID=2835866 RepID=UPI001BDD685C|nr:amidohydrolase family protein [Pseudonocardia sp. H11422]
MVALPVWRGIGEVLLRHDDLTNLTAGEQPSASHPALDPVFDFARTHGCPLALHHDSSSAGRAGDHEYVPQLDMMLRRHPRTTVVWCHAGVARRIEPRRQADVVADLLTAHDNLHIDISWSLVDRILGEDGTPAGDWTTLIDRHPDRFVVGSDNVGRPGGLPDTIKTLSPLLDALPPRHRQLVAVDNATRLWFS